MCVCVNIFGYDEHKTTWNMQSAHRKKLPNEWTQQVFHYSTHTQFIVNEENFKWIHAMQCGLNYFKLGENGKLTHEKLLVLKIRKIPSMNALKRLLKNINLKSFGRVRSVNTFMWNCFEAVETLKQMCFDPIEKLTVPFFQESPTAKIIKIRPFVHLNCEGIPFFLKTSFDGDRILPIGIIFMISCRKLIEIYE